MSDKGNSLGEWKQANSDRRFCCSDYLNAVYGEAGIHPDFVQCFIQLVWPEFTQVDGKVFLSDLFEVEKYRDYLSQGQSEEDAQAWMNLLDITGLFEGIDYSIAQQVAGLLVKAWNAKLSLEFGQGAAAARLIVEEQEQGVLVTIGNFTGIRSEV